MAENDDIDPNFVVETPWSRTKIMVAIGLIFCVTIFSWYYYEYKYLPFQPIPLLKADEGPTRIKPEGTDGILIPNTDKMVYDNFTPFRTEALKSVSIMPEPEQPMQIAKKEEQDVIEDIIGKILSAEETPQPASVETQVASQTSSAKTLNIVSIQKQDSSNTQHVASSKNGKNCYRIQLVSVRTAENAEVEWERLKKMHYKTLGRLPHFVQKMTLENGIFYRLLAGEFTSFGQAKIICKKLIRLQQNCLVTSDKVSF